MTLAEQFRQEGRHEGRQEGRHEGEIHSRRQALQDVLEVRFSPVPAGLKEALSGISELERLEQLLKVAVVCPDLESFVLKL